MKILLSTSIALLTLANPAFADGDAAEGEKEFKKCKSCHMIVSPEGDVVVKGGKTGPNLWGVIGRAAGSAEDFKFSSSIIAAGEGGLIWDIDNVQAYMTDPKAFLIEVTGDEAAKSKMTFKLKDDQEDVAAFLAANSPAPAE